MKKVKHKWTGPQNKNLDASIAHWERVCTGDDNRVSVWDCDCCVAYRHIYGEDGPASCRSCPIKIYSGKRYCENTPYINAATEVKRNMPGRNCRAELAFLKEVKEAGNGKG